MGTLYVRKNGEIVPAPGVYVRVQNESSPDGDIVQNGGIPVPAYVAEEAERVAGEVLALQNADTLTFLATSDIHYSQDNSVDLMNNFTDDIGNAVHLLRSKINADFEADLGDKAFGATAYPNEDTAGEAMRVIEKLGYTDTRLECLGNHDTHNTTVAQREMFTARRNRGVVYGDTTNGYCYLDVGNIRVIVLNTSEMGDDTYSSAITMRTAQLQWLCTVLAEMAGKTGYHILLLSHMPPDWGVTSAESELLKILKAYETGGRYTVSGTTYDFSATGRADIIGWCHGHLHNHKFRKIAGTDIWRFCIPGALKTRANEYSNKSDYPDAAFQELFGNETLTKGDYTIGTATSTAFSVVVIDPVKKIISIINYGAGGAERNRVINYGSAVTYYAISNVLTNVKNSNSATSIAAGAAYSASLTVTAGELSSVKVTMGGVDITDSVCKDGAIFIQRVTGNIVITATAIESGGDDGTDDDFNVTNLVPTATVVNGTAIYNGVGYKDGYRISGGISESALAGYVMTGAITYKENSDGTHKTIYIRGAALDTSDSSCRWTGLPENATVSNTIQLNGGATNAGYRFSDYFTVETLGEKYYKMTPKESGFDGYGRTVVGFLMSLKGSGANLIITLDEPIE